MEKKIKGPNIYWATISILLIIAGLAFQKEGLLTPLISKVLVIAGGVLFLLAYTKIFWLMTKREFQSKNDEA